MPVVASQIHFWQLTKTYIPTVGIYHSNSIIHLKLQSMAFRIDSCLTL